MEIKQKYKWVVYKNHDKTRSSPPPRSAAIMQICVRLKKCGTEKKGDTSVSKQRLLKGNWSRAWVFLGPQPPSIFPQRWIYSKLPSWLEGERRGWRKSEARPNFTFTEVRSSYTMSQPTAPIRSCPALPPSVCGLGYMGNVSAGRR